MIRARQILPLALAAMLAGCLQAARPPVESTAAKLAEPAPPQPTMSRESAALAAYYSDIEADLRAQGMMRTDGGGPDTPYDAEMLVRNFTEIALYEEYANIGGQLVARRTPSRIHRWEDPVRIAIAFGAAVPDPQRTSDTRAIRRYAQRIARLTGHPVTVTDEAPNFHVFIVGEGARRALGPRLREIIPSISTTAVTTVTSLPRSSYCLVFAWDPEDDGTYAKAVAVIRAEHPNLLRLSCIHEEIAQGMGLSNDSPLARPSVFNDDEEFGLLTSHDEMLLRMLYDPRLRPGMGPDEAAPIIRRIAEELAGETG